MKKSLASLFVFLLVASGSAMALPFSNGGFESGGISPWYNASTGGTWTGTSVNAHSGAYSATDIGNYEIRQDFDAILADDILELSFWLEQPELAATFGVLSYVTLYYSDFTQQGAIASTYGAGEGWRQLDITSRLDTGKFLTGIGFYGYSGGGDFEDRSYLDDVVIRTATSVPEPSTFALYLIALAGLIAIRKRKTQ